MASNRTPTRFYGPAYLTTTDTSLYTVPANKIAVIRQASVIFGDPDEFFLGIGGATNADDRFAYVDSATAGITPSLWFYVVLAAAEEIYGLANSGSFNVVIALDGDLYDV